MKRLIIYESVHHKNTEKIAKVMADVLKAELRNPKDVNVNEIKNYDLIGFGSGIYYGKFHKNMLEFIKDLKTLDNQKAFVFSTSGMGKEQYNDPIKKALNEKGIDVIDDFACKGFDTYGPFKIVGGIAKGRPNEEDFSKAREFVAKLTIL